MMNFLSFFPSGKGFISPPCLKESFGWYSILNYQFFSFSILNMSSCSLLSCMVSVENSVARWIDALLCVISFSSVAYFWILSLSLTFKSLVSICLGVVYLVIIWFLFVWWFLTLLYIDFFFYSFCFYLSLDLESFLL